MTGRRWKLFVGLGAALAMVAALSAPAGGEAGSSPRAGAADCTGPGIDNGTIKIGVLYEESGPQAATFADTVKGLKARLAKLEDDGGLPNGLKIEFVTADDAADDSQNLTAAKRLAEEEDVFLVFEVTSHSKGSGTYLNQKKVPVVGWAIDAVWGRYDNMFGYRNSFSPDPKGSQTTTTPAVLKKLGGKRIAVVGFDNSASTLAVENTAAAIKKFGLKVAYKAIVPAGSKEFTSVVEKMKEKKADGIFTAMDIFQNEALLKAVDQAGIRDQFKAIVFPFGYDPRVPKIFGTTFNGAHVGTDFKPYEQDLPAHKEFFKYYAQENGADAVTSQISMVSWLAAEAMIKGFEVAGKCPTRASYIKNLRNVKGFDAGGLIQPVDFKKAFGQPILCLYYVELVDDHWEIAFDGKIQCGKEL